MVDKLLFFEEFIAVFGAAQQIEKVDRVD